MKAVEATDSNFQLEVLSSPIPVLIDFWASWCGPCKMLAPVMEELATEFNGKLKVCKMDVDSNQDIAMQYGIRSLPTLLLFKDGKVVEQMIGAAQKRTIIDKVTPHL